LDEKLSTISAFTKSTIIELRDTIWAMNHDEISFEDLRVRIHNFMEKAKEVKENISFAFDIDASLKGITCTSVQGMNIYRTVQEAVNNSIKYADASQIRVKIQMIEEKVSIQISDNGKGFNLEEYELGNGIVNMKKRITDINGTLTIYSKIGQGTTITILLEDIKA
jgi:signal transduction histidine kinase